MSTRALLSLIFLQLQFGELNGNTVDASAGSYSCYPCGRAQCGFENGGSDYELDPPSNGSERNFEPMTCRQLQQAADNRAVDPEMCSHFSQLTRSTGDPCGCKQRVRPFQAATTSSKCVDPNQAQPCNLCGHGKLIGDPEKQLPSPYPSTCVSFYDLQIANLNDGQGGFSNRMCNDLKTLFAQNDRCKCRPPSEVAAVEKCVLQLNLDDQCNPNKSDDQCCVGGCKWLNTYNAFLCTTQPGDTPPDTPEPVTTPSPSSKPSAAPSRFPSSWPSISPSVSPSQSLQPSQNPSISFVPTKSMSPSMKPTTSPSTSPSSKPSQSPSETIIYQAPPRLTSSSPSSSPSQSPTAGATAFSGFTFLFCDDDSDCPTGKTCTNRLCM